MTSSPVDVGQALAQSVRVTNETLIVDLADGRTLTREKELASCGAEASVQAQALGRAAARGSFPAR